MAGRGSIGDDAPQTPAEISGALEDYLALFPRAVVMEDGKVLFDLREAKYTLSTEHGRCTLHLWSEERNLVRRVTRATGRPGTREALLRLETLRLGQSKPGVLELAGDRDRRTPSTRERTRERYVKTLERVLARQFPDWRPDSFRTAMDLEKSFGPAYARGLLVAGREAWAVIAVNCEEAPATIDGILTFGILWLEACRAQGGGRRLLKGLKLVLPRGAAAPTLARMAWLRGEPSAWELWELDEADRDEQLLRLDPSDAGNLRTRLPHAPNEAAARERFEDAAAQVLALVPEASRSTVEQRLRSGSELAFLLYGLEFARVRFGSQGESFNRAAQVSFGAGAHETELTAANAGELRELVARLCERRRPRGNARDPLYRAQPERWLEGELRRDVTVVDRTLDPRHLHTQVPAFAAGDRGMLDLLGVSTAGQLVILELKADEDPHLALQGLDYWIRVRWHHAQHPDAASGLGEFQRNGYFGGVRLAATAPHLLLVAPALRIHPATEVVLRHLSSRVDWTLVAISERWREEIKVVWRRRSTDPPTPPTPPR